MDNFESRVRGLAKRMDQRSHGAPEDGLALAVVRPLCGWFLWAWSNAVFVPLLLVLRPVAEKACQRLAREYSDSGLYAMTIDMYKGVMSSVTIGAYVAVWLALIYEWPIVVVTLPLLFAVCRFLEMVSLMILLFFTRPDAAALASFRPIVNAFWSYLEFAMIFGVFYLCLAVFDADAYSVASNGRFGESFVDGLYFSCVTLATVGYGDISPRCLLGKLVVIVETCLGVFLIVSVVQKALARTPDVVSKP